MPIKRRYKHPKYVNGFKNRRRPGDETRYYFRAPRMAKAIRLPGPLYSESFNEAYAMALAALPESKIEIGEKRTAPGTIDALIVSYYRSGEWLALAEDTREARRRIIEKFRVRHGTKPVHLIAEAHLVKIMNDVTSLSSRRSWLKAIKHLLQHAMPIMRKDNPAENIAQVKLPQSKGHWTWTDDQIATYRKHWKLGTKQRLVFEFALETVSRRGEVVRFGPQHCYIGSEGERRIRIERTHGSEDVDLPISDALAAAIDAMPLPTPINGIVPLTFLHTERGQMRSKKALGNDFAGWVKLAGLPDQCRLHGLKKGGMRRGAEAGLTTHELMGRSGHKSLAEVERYTKAANQRKLADSAAAKLADAATKGPRRITDQSAANESGSTNLQTLRPKSTNTGLKS